MSEQLQIAGDGERVALREQAVPNPNGRGPLWAIAVCVVGVAIATTTWFRPEHDSLLCRNLLKEDADRICRTLADIGLSYSFSDSGSAIYVPRDEVHAARIEIAKSIGPDEPLPFHLITVEGATLSITSAAYAAALQSELEATICALSGIESARVLIETPGNRGRLNGERPLAAVIVSSAPSATLTAEQIKLIQNLVASSTDFLTPGEVTVTENRDSESLVQFRTQPYDH